MPGKQPPIHARLLLAGVLRLIESGAEAKVYWAMADHAANNNRLECWPGLEALVAETGCPRRAVQRAWASLTRKGLLKRLTHGGPGHNAHWLVREPTTGAANSARTSAACDAQLAPPVALELAPPMTELAPPVTGTGAAGDTLTPHNPPRTKRPGSTPRRSPTEWWKFAESLLSLGSSLACPKFRKAWIEWVGHRAEIGKPLTERGTRVQIRNLEDWANGNSDIAIECIDRAIAGRWQGLFRDRTAAGRPGQGEPTRPRATDGRYDIVGQVVETVERTVEDAN